MATNVTMPKLGLTMETGKIVEWKAAEGGDVKEGEILLIVETEKITYEVEAPASGLLHIVVAAEEEVPVAELIGIIAADKAELDSLPAGGAPAADAPVPAAPAAGGAPAPAVAAPAGDVNVVVIGGGPGGYPAAIRASQLGAKVTIIEKDQFGGTCLNRGCIPTKALLQSAGTYKGAKEAATFGVNIGDIKVDFPAVMARKNTVVKQLVGGLGGR